MSIAGADGRARSAADAPPPPLEALRYDVMGRLIGVRAGAMEALVAAAPEADWAAVRENAGGARDALERFQYATGETLYTRLLRAAADQRLPARGRALVCALHTLTGLSLAETRDFRGHTALETALLCDLAYFLPRERRGGWRHPGVQVFAFATARDEGMFWCLARDPPRALVGAPTHAEFYAGGDTALHVAARALRFDLIEALVAVFGLDPAVPNAAGQRAVDVLVDARDRRRGQPMVTPVFRDAFIRARALLTRGAPRAAPAPRAGFW